MTDSLPEFKRWLSNALMAYKPSYKHFTGDFIDYTDEHKDDICYNFLLNFPSWWDDVLPPQTSNPSNFLFVLYRGSFNESISISIREDIYLSLEIGLADIVESVFNETFNIPVEEFAGYEVGQ